MIISKDFRLYITLIFNDMAVVKFAHIKYLNSCESARLVYSWWTVCCGNSVCKCILLQVKTEVISKKPGVSIPSYKEISLVNSFVIFTVAI